MKPKRQELFEFIEGLRTVELALLRGARQPLTDDPLLNAYDFRRQDLPPPHKQLQALAAAGYSRPRGYDKGVWLFDTLGDLCASYARQNAPCTLSISAMARLVCSFRDYAALKAGTKTRHRLLRT